MEEEGFAAELCGRRILQPSIATVINLPPQTTIARAECCRVWERTQAVWRERGPGVATPCQFISVNTLPRD